MIPTVNGEVLAAVYGAAEAQAEAPRPAAPAPQAGGADGERPGDRYEREATWEEVFQGTGAALAPGNGTLRYVTRPGHEGHGHGATVGVRERSGADLLHVFTTNWPPFQSGQSYNKFAAYTHLHHGGDFAAAAAALAARYRGQAGGADGTEGPTGYELILAWMRERYEFVFRRGGLPYSAREGRLVKPGEATFAPDHALALRLAGARDVPRSQDGSPKLNSLCQFFREWARVAYATLVPALPLEQDTAEVNMSAEESFRGRIAALLLTQVTLAVGAFDPAHPERPQRQERRTMLDWASRLATKERWDDVRSYLLWVKPREGGGVRIALRYELFEQLKVSPPEVSSHRAFTSLCEVYGVGSSVRAGGERAVELAPEFVAWLLGRPAEVDAMTEDSRPRASHEENGVSPSTLTQSEVATQVDVDGRVDDRENPSVIVNDSVNARGQIHSHPRPSVDGEFPMDGGTEDSVNGSVNGEEGEEGRGDAWEGPGEL